MVFVYDKTLWKKGAVSIILNLTADIFIQKKVQEFEKIDWERVIRQSSVSFIATVTFNNWWIVRVIPAIWRTPFFKNLTLTQKSLYQLYVIYNNLLQPCDCEYYISTFLIDYS